MSTPRSFLWLFAAVLVGAACSPSGDDTATSTSQPSTAATTTGTSAPNPNVAQSVTEPPTTTAVGASTVTPSYLVYGWDGVTRVHDNESERLVPEPVLWATDDGAGGIVFEVVAAKPGRAWLPAGTDRPTEIPTGFFFLLDGQPTALVSRVFDDMTRCENEDFMEELSIRDLATGAERFFMCRGSSSDGRREVTSFGGGLFSSLARWQLIGSGSGDLRFYNVDGQEVTVEHNLFSKSCGPCHMNVRLSVDGALLAYSLWPTAFLGYPEPSNGDYSRAYGEWYQEQQHIPTEVVVVDMATGVEVFRTAVVADAELTGFDGRVVTLTTGAGRELFDIETGERFTAPPALTGPAPFWTVVLASLDNTTMDYDAAQLVAGDLAAQHGVQTGVLWSDGFVTLSPGYWALFTGHFSTQGEAVAYCEALATDCYPRYMAAADIDGPGSNPDPPGLILRHDGLGAGSFGDRVDDVLAVLMEHLGAPTNDEQHESPFEVPTGRHSDNRGPDACHVATTGYVCFDYIRFVWWENSRLAVVFSDIDAHPGVEPADEGYWVQIPPSLQGWSYRGSESPRLYTAHGITVGSTAEDLMSLGPIVSFNWTPCGNHVEFTISDQGRGYPQLIYGSLDDQDFEAYQQSGIPNENAEVVGLNAGQGSSC